MKPKSSTAKLSMQIKFQTRYEVPWTGGSQLFAIDLSGWRLLEPVVDSSKCRHCGTCYLFCPTGCIQNHETHYAANLKYCKGCGICVRECPTKALTMVERS